MRFNIYINQPLTTGTLQKASVPISDWDIQEGCFLFGYVDGNWEYAKTVYNFWLEHD